MPQVKFEKQISLSPVEAFDKLKSLLVNITELKKIDPSIVISVNEEKMGLVAEGQKVSGNILIAPDGAKNSVVKIDLNIPWTYAPFKPIIIAKLEEKISELC